MAANNALKVVLEILKKTILLTALKIHFFLFIMVPSTSRIIMSTHPSFRRQSKYLGFQCVDFFFSTDFIFIVLSGSSLFFRTVL